MRRHQHLLPLRDPGPHPLRHRRPFRPPQHLPQLVQPHQMLAGRPGHRRPHPRITTSIPAGTGVGVIPVATVTDRPGNTRPTSARQFSVRSGLHATTNGNAPSNAAAAQLVIVLPNPISSPMISRRRDTAYRTAGC